jgi:hypothetical protein
MWNYKIKPEWQIIPHAWTWHVHLIYTRLSKLIIVTNNVNTTRNIWDGVFLQWIPFICVKNKNKNKND